MIDWRQFGLTTVRWVGVAICLFFLTFGHFGCAQIVPINWKYVGDGSDDYRKRTHYCTEFAIYQYPLANWEDEMDEEEYQERNFGRQLSPRFEKKFVACMENNNWRRLS